MKTIILFLSMFYFLYSSSATLIQDGIKIVKTGERSCSYTSEMNTIIKVGRLSQLTADMLSASKLTNIYDLMNLAVKEKRIGYVEQFKYIDVYKRLKDGDKLLLDCLIDKSCKLQKYTSRIRSTYISDKILSSQYVIRGWINDMKVHKFIDGHGNPMYAKISEVVDLKRTIKMEYIGSKYINTNAAGFERNAKKFWQEYSKKYPEVLSKNNLELIKNGNSPIVDKQWIKFNPKHKSFIGERLEHHHLNNTDIAVGIPESLHRGANNKELMHVDR